VNKHSIIVIIASIVIVTPFALSAWNIFASEQLELRWTEKDSFNYFEMSNDGDITVCNPFPFFVHFTKLEIKTIYDQRDKGVFSADGVSIPPLSTSILSGKFSSENFAESQYLFMHLDGEFAGTAPIRIDPTKMFVTTEIHTSILGFIPYSVSEEFTGLEFNKIMKDQTENSC
jgi:hypothetical protein